MDKAVKHFELKAIENQENIMVFVITMSMEQLQYHSSSYLKSYYPNVPPIFRIAMMRDMEFHLKD
jgi:hypothetical protein